MKSCDSCHKNIGNYKENEYTYLCGKCWYYIAHNIFLNWQKDNKVYLWIFNNGKLV